MSRKASQILKKFIFKVKFVIELSNSSVFWENDQYDVERNNHLQILVDLYIVVIYWATGTAFKPNQKKKKKPSKVVLIFS